MATSLMQLLAMHAGALVMEWTHEERMVMLKACRMDASVIELGWDNLLNGAQATTLEGVKAAVKDESNRQEPKRRYDCVR
mmetsp:Transcript_21208/g.35001  ORF Transcript_21208/g.35001 Transcript_21208/m.35001 type:complete len:80 (-) Transcript_21208:49-288(-)